MGNNDLNHRILLFSASFHCEPLKVAQYEQNKNLFLSCPAQFSRISLQIFRSYGISFLVFSFFCCLETCRLPRQILRPKQIFRRTGKPGSFSKVWKNWNCDVLLQYCQSCYIWKIRQSKVMFKNRDYNIERVLGLYKSYWALMNKIFIYARSCVNKMTWALFLSGFRVSVLLSCRAVFLPF